jgi:hypothetical protein
LLDLLDHARSFVADHEVDSLDPCEGQRIQGVRDQGAAKQWDKRL